MASEFDLQLPASIQQQLEALVRATGKSELEVLQEAIAKYAAENQSSASCLDVALAAGFVAADQDGPDDLSTNPKYMEGFGRD